MFVSDLFRDVSVSRRFQAGLLAKMQTPLLTRNSQNTYSYIFVDVRDPAGEYQYYPSLLQFVPAGKLLCTKLSWPKFEIWLQPPSRARSAIIPHTEHILMAVLKNLWTVYEVFPFSSSSFSPGRKLRPYWRADVLCTRIRCEAGSHPGSTSGDDQVCLEISKLFPKNRNQGAVQQQ